MRGKKYYPLHLHTSLNSISKLIPFLSLIVLLVDSRIPLLEGIYLREINRRWPGKKILVIFTKSDLIPKRDLRENSFNLLEQSSKHRLLKLILGTIEGANLSPRESTNSIILMGGANSGKSSFINLLVGRKKARKTPEPGTTRGLSRHKVPETNLIIYDSPGLFPSNMGNSLYSLLQLLNCLPPIQDSKSVFSEWGYSYLVRYYPDKIKRFVGLEEGSEIPAYYSFLGMLALKYNLLEEKGELSTQKAEEKFIQLVRKNQIGKIVWKI